MGQQFRHGGEDLNIGAVCGHVVQPPLHVPRARIDFAERFAVDHEGRPTGFVYLQGRPESMTRGQIGQGIRHDVCMDIDYGQLESSPGFGRSPTTRNIEIKYKKLSLSSFCLQLRWPRIRRQRMKELEE